MNDLSILQEMGLKLWQLRGSEHITMPQQPIVLPSECQLLFISWQPPTVQQLPFLTKVLASIKLDISQAYFLPVEAVASVAKLPSWCWFVEVEAMPLANTKLLVSCDLTKLEYDVQSKRHLWQQIKNYDAASSS